MTTPVATRQSLRERLADLTDAMTVGVWPPDGCGECESLPGLCDKCKAQAADVEVLAHALDAIAGAETDGIAVAAYAKCVLLDLPGITPQQAIDALVAIRLERRLEVIEAGGAR
jgi:hypothetical protein